VLEPLSHLLHLKPSFNLRPRNGLEHVTGQYSLFEVSLGPPFDGVDDELPILSLP
jgi:hypothetical protein